MALIDALLQLVRGNARVQLKHAARIIATSYPLLRKLWQTLTTYVIKHVTQLEYKELGHPYHYYLIIEHAHPLLIPYLKGSVYVNNMYRLDDQRVGVEVLFAQMHAYYRFLDDINQFGCAILQVCTIQSILQFEEAMLPVVCKSI